MDPSTSIAYIDPGSGTLAVQAMLAAALGGLFWLVGFARKALVLPSKRRALDQDATNGHGK